MSRALPMVLLLLSCQDVIVAGAVCQESSDCPLGESCLYDLDRKNTYCSSTCDRDQDCRPEQVCRAGTPAAGLGEQQRRVCVDRLRSCAEKELCNGLDDNCDGVVDEAGCELVTRCSDDQSCGTFVCQPTANQPTTVCVPPNEQASGADFGLCSNGAECKNGICETGWCAPLCRAGDTETCPPDFTLPSGRTQPSLCVRGVGDRARPAYNTCQLACQDRSECRANQDCVWRTVINAGDEHAFVCSSLDSMRKPLGAECTNNEPLGGDDECQHGLCFGFRCTRICGGPGSSCADMDPDNPTAYACLSETLRYGARAFTAFICKRPN